MAPKRSGAGSAATQQSLGLRNADWSVVSSAMRSLALPPDMLRTATSLGPKGMRRLLATSQITADNEADEQSVLRTATRISLAGSPGGSAGSSWPSSEEVMQAASCEKTLLKLWSRSGSSRIMARATEAAQRRVDESEVDRRAYLKFSNSVIIAALNFCHCNYMLSDSLLAATVGFLEHMSRLLARGYGAAAATRPEATEGGGSQGGKWRNKERLLVLHEALTLLLELSTRLRFIVETVATTSVADKSTSHQEAAAASNVASSGSAASCSGSAASTSGSAASTSGSGEAQQQFGDAATRVFPVLLTELAESNLLEHLAKEMYEMAAGCRGLINKLLTACTFMFRPRVYCAELLTAHLPRLPGPCMLHLLTAAAVEVLRPVDDGPSYGLPAEASQTIQKLLSEVDLSGDLNADVLNVLQCWVLALTPGAGFNPQSFISAAATYELCLRVVAAVTRAEEARRGARKVAAATAQRQLPAKRGSIALSASIAAHDALAYMRTKGLRRDAAASAEGSGALVRPEEWWRAAVQSLRFTADNVGSEGADPTVAWKGVQLLIRRLSKGQMALPLPEAMPASPPPDVAAALSAGYLPCLLQLARLAHKDKGIIANCVLSALPTLPQLGWLLHYSDKRQASELLTAMQDLVPSLVDSKLVGRYEAALLDAIKFCMGQIGVCEGGEDAEQTAGSSSGGVSGMV
ncbi:hypothetical protein Agub_g12897 [Astrephomene gubernaculifera]|uniref:Uncharacterized protein n=1 Tax=Astrephomene gubernaculifera TaxID=47775 RepID=A0AAD3E1N6_9CHLO|nr:hypothetical protein Agub_g12897 [Astrephomene gubernaculifera]